MTERINIEIAMAAIAEAMAKEPEFITALCQNPAFIEDLRLSMTTASRGLGNLYATKAQREPRPKFVQPNTTQRIF